MVNWFRSLMFNIVMFSWITILVVFAWLLIPFPRRIMQGMFRKWAHVAIWAMRIFGGIDVRFIGLDKIPKGPALIASKHQSIWDTFIMYVLLDDPQYILKQELMRIPFWGWSAQKSEHIPIDREAGAKALRDMVDACVDRLSKGRQVIIFPHRTRRGLPLSSGCGGAVSETAGRCHGGADGAQFRGLLGPAQVCHQAGHHHAGSPGPDPARTAAPRIHAETGRRYRDGVDAAAADSVSNPGKNPIIAP
jgi:1-acyl-sn-glycerol-3-phosphate acyltransferase